jgi:hypothetical protein
MFCLSVTLIPHTAAFSYNLGRLPELPNKSWPEGVGSSSTLLIPEQVIGQEDIFEFGSVGDSPSLFLLSNELSIEARYRDIASHMQTKANSLKFAEIWARWTLSLL